MPRSRPIYADDTTCTVADKNIDKLQEKCEESVNKLLTYMAINKLSANDDKTHIIVVKHGKVKKEMSFQIGDAKIKESENEKFLGLWVNNDLTWTKHLKKLQEELLHRLFTLRQMEQVIPKSLLPSIADGIVVSILRYGLGIYCPVRIYNTDPKPTCINSIQVIYHDVLRFLCNTRRNKHTSIQSMLEKLGWLSLNQMCAEVRLIEVWKGLNLENYCLEDMFEKADSAKLNVRNSSRNRLKSSFKSRLRENSFHYPSVRLWNAAPEEVTNAMTETSARTAIRKHVLTLPI